MWVDLAFGIGLNCLYLILSVLVGGIEKDSGRTWGRMLWMSCQLKGFRL